MSQRQNMLIRVRDTFHRYAGEHRRKAARFNAEARGCSDEVEVERLKVEEVKSIEKADFNDEMIREIKEVLDTPTENVIERTAKFGKIVYPDGFTPTSQQAQLGVHFEEVAEMVPTLKSSDPEIEAALLSAWEANKTLGELLKSRSNTPTIVVEDRVEFIDAVADVLVTATLSAIQFNMDPVGALTEVNRSNFSKLTDGKMALTTDTNKWIKGPDYSPPRLNRFT